MTEPTKKPDTPNAEQVIEFVQDINPMYLLLAFLAGAVIVAAIVYAMGSKALTEETPDA